MRALLSTIAFGAFAAFLAPAFAAEQGLPGESSTGSVTISASISAPPEPIVQITGLDDISFGDVTNVSQSLVVADGFICIYHTSPTISVEITPPADGSFLANTDPRFADALLPLDFLVLETGSDETLALVNPFLSVRGSGIVANRSDPTCATGPSQYTVAALRERPTGATPGVYAGTFQITLAVE